MSMEEALRRLRLKAVNLAQRVAVEVMYEHWRVRALEAERNALWLQEENRRLDTALGKARMERDAERMGRVDLEHKIRVERKLTP